MNRLVGDVKKLADQKVNQAEAAAIQRLRSRLHAMRADLARRELTFSSGVAIQALHTLACGVLEDLIWSTWAGLADVLHSIPIETPSGLANEIREYLQPRADQLERVALGIADNDDALRSALARMRPDEKKAIENRFQTAIRDRKATVWNRVSTAADLLEAELVKQHRASERAEQAAYRRHRQAISLTVGVALVGIATTWLLQCNRQEQRKAVDLPRAGVETRPRLAPASSPDSMGASSSHPDTAQSSSAVPE